MSASSLRPCDSCGRFRQIVESSCPHCGALGKGLGRSTRAALVGLAIGGSFACVQEAKYGSLYYPDGDDTADTADTAEPQINRTAQPLTTPSE